MSLPLPPLPLPPPHVDEEIEVRNEGKDRVFVRVGSMQVVLTRYEAFRLLGYLERAAGAA